MSTLPARLLIPAKLFFQNAQKANVPAILFGGAAAKLNGAKRDTRDLDINVADIKKISKQLGPFSGFECRPGSSDSRLHVTYLDDSDAIKCDIASDFADLLPVFMKYSYEDSETGIRYALPPLLLADKIRTYTQRAAGADGKRANDLDDIYTMVDLMEKKEEVMPDELLDLILNEGVLKTFYDSVPDHDKATLQFFLAPLGVFIHKLEQD